MRTTRYYIKPLDISSISPMTEMTAKQIDGLLHKRHGSDPWVYFSQLRSKTGARPGRTIDGYAMKVWPSSFRAIAYEIKVSRSDFMNEIEDPSKRKPFVKNSNEFYYVVPHGLVHKNEVPKETGLMWAQSGSKEARVIKKKAAPQGEEVESFPKLFVAALLRKSAPAYTGMDLFHYAGRDLTEKEMQDLVEQKAREKLEDRKYQKKRKEEAKEELLQNGFERYKAVYEWVQSHRRELGISGFQLDEHALEQWWEEKNEVNGHAVEKALGEISRAESSLENAKERLESQSEK